MFWRKWVATDLDLGERLSHLTDPGQAVTLMIPPTGLAIRVYTDSSQLASAVREVFSRTEATPEMRVGYFTDPETFRVVSGWTGMVEVGLSLVNPSVRTLIAFGPVGRGYLMTTIRGMCHLEVDPKGFVPVHGAVLENGLAIVGTSGAGKSTLGLRLALEEKVTLIADDWSCWQIGSEVRAIRVGDPMAISAPVLSTTRHLLSPGLVDVVERELQKKAKVKIGHVLFPTAPDSVVIRRVFLATKAIDQNLAPQLVHSNYHIPFVFPWSTEEQSREFILSSTSPTPFLRQVERVAAFWGDICQRVPVIALDTSGSIDSTLRAIRVSLFEFPDQH